MKLYFQLVFLFICSIGFSQLSDKHWIPPLHAREATAVNDHYLYLSTPSATPFQVTVTTGNGAQITGSPFTISQGNPVQILIGNSQPSTMFVGTNELNTPTSKGLILEGSDDFYVSFRVRAQYHAESLISKGRLGKGTTFRLGSLPQNSNGGIRNFVSSFMATEDNTIVTLSDYNTGVTFVTPTGNNNAPIQTFGLNAGQSIVVSGYTNVTANLNGFVGALVSSTKPIVVNTGNAMGGMGDEQQGQDFNLDQIVGYENIGKEYIVVKGNGSNISERPLVIATQDNTDVFVNDEIIPAANLNAGEYYLIPATKYQGTNNLNMFIKANKNIYMYQIIAGSTNDATSGLNFIPPLSCFFQTNIDLIPDINKIGNTSYSGELIGLTTTGSTLSINGVAVSNLPEPVLGNPQWVSYRISNLTGNIVVESSGPLAVGVFGASGAAGFGGYYSGFGSEPRDTFLDVCDNQTLDLLEALDGNPEPGGFWIPALSSGTNIYDPTVDTATSYEYTFTKTCFGETITQSVTIELTVFAAPFAGTNSSLTLCRNDEPINLFDLLGTGVTTGGTWNQTLTNNILDPNTAVSGDYIYTINGQAPCTTSSGTIQITITELPVTTNVSDFILCDDETDGNNTNGESFFDLNTKNIEVINGQNNISVAYYDSMLNAENGTNAISSITTTGTTIFYVLTNDLTGCKKMGSFELIVLPTPIFNSGITLFQCDTDAISDGITSFNLNEANELINPNTTSNSVIYFESIADLNANNPILDTQDFESGTTTVYALITNDNGCTNTGSISLSVSNTQINPTYNFPIYKCDVYVDDNNLENDGFDDFDFTLASADILSQLPTSSGISIRFYENENEALSETNEITNITDYRNTTAFVQNIWVRLESTINNECIGLGEFITLYVTPTPTINASGDYVLCVDPETGLGNDFINATPSLPGNYSYNWTPANPITDALGNQSALFEITDEGYYTVLVTNTDSGCSTLRNFTSTISSEPVNVTAVLITDLFESGTATIQAVATGGFGNYEYSLDGENWQDSPTFTGLENGSYIIFVKDEKSCGIISSNEVISLTYPNYFTPNGDGYNDLWNIENIGLEYKASISIFDRHGKLITVISPYELGWDGTYNGQQLPSTDYWFKIDYFQQGVLRTFKANFSLKR